MNASCGPNSRRVPFRIGAIQSLINLEANMAEKFYAGFFVRVFAALLDLAFLTPIVAIFLYIFGINGNYEMLKIKDVMHGYVYSKTEFTTLLHSDLITYGVSIFYLTYFVAKKGQATFGKKLMGIYVGNPDGSKLSAGKSLARALASLLTAATIGIGFLLVIFTKEKTALHDLICNTRVFHGKK